MMKGAFGVGWDGMDGIGMVIKGHRESKSTRVAGLGRLSAGAKMAMKPFVKRVFTIFATNASFFLRNRKFANLPPVPPQNFCHPALSQCNVLQDDDFFLP